MELEDLGVDLDMLLPQGTMGHGDMLSNAYSEHSWEPIREAIRRGWKKYQGGQTELPLKGAKVKTAARDLGRRTRNLAVGIIGVQMYNVLVQFTKIDPDGGAPTAEGIKDLQDFDSLKAAVDFGIKMMPVVTDPNVGYSRPYETQIVDDSIAVWDASGSSILLTEAIVSRYDGEPLSEQELRYMEDAVYDAAREQDVKIRRKIRRNSAARNISRDPLEVAREAQEMISDIRAEAMLRGQGDIVRAARDAVNQIYYLIELLDR